MKLTTRALQRLSLSLSLIGFACAQHAAIANNAFSRPNCPPYQQVTNVNFSKADPLVFLGKYHSWLLTSDNDYHYNGRAWSTAFRLNFPEEVTSAEEALKRGKAFFASKIQVTNYPSSREVHGHFICYYAENDEYIIGAVTPPIHGPMDTTSM